MLNKLKTFARKEDGAVTVDWVVLVAGVVALAVLIVASMQTGAVSLSANVETMLSGWTF